MKIKESTIKTDETNTISFFLKLFKQIAERESEILACVVMGSLGRGDYKSSSDIDLIYLVDKNSKNRIHEIVNKQIQNFELYKITYPNPLKLIYYLQISKYENLNSLQKVDLYIVEDLAEVERFILGSNIINYSKAILVDKKGEATNYLLNLKQRKKPKIEQAINYNISRFIEMFEMASRSHKKGDSYAYYFHYNISYHHLIVLKYISLGETNFLYLPKNYFIKAYSANERQKREEFIKKIEPTQDLRTANKSKINLKEEFISTLKHLKVKYQINIREIEQFLEKVIERDYFWNLRDISRYCPKIKNGLIFRSSALSRYCEERIFSHLKEKINIKTIIDLRYKEEIRDYPYSLRALNNITYYNIEINPFLVKDRKCRITNPKYSFYEIFPRCYKEEILQIFKALLEAKPPIVIHCYAGKDRTGMIVALFQLLFNHSKEDVLRDYLDSELDATEEALKVFFAEIEKEGSVLHYLESCGINQNMQNNLIEKFKSDRYKKGYR